MTMRGSDTAPDPVEEIEGRWTLRVLLRLRQGEQRFSDLRTALPGINPNILTKRIRSLESAGLVQRRYLPPPYASQVYALTPAADTLKPALDALARWHAGQSSD